MCWAAHPPPSPKPRYPTTRATIWPARGVNPTNCSDGILKRTYATAATTPRANPPRIPPNKKPANTGMKSSVAATSTKSTPREMATSPTRRMRMKPDISRIVRARAKVISQPRAECTEGLTIARSCLPCSDFVLPWPCCWGYS